MMMKINGDILVAVKLEHPEFTLQAIADGFGSSKQAVWDRLKKKRLPTVSSLRKNTRVCPKCGGRKNHEATVCRKCYLVQLFKEHWTTLLCMECGLVFSRRNASIRQARKRGQKLVFCSYRCNGRWTGKHYGFGRESSGNQASDKGLVEE